jgi:hypothetical protein
VRSGGRWGDGCDHELLIERDDEFDEGVIERLVFDISGPFDESEEVGDEGEGEVGCTVRLSSA